MNQLQFHIIVPAYNAAKSIERCIRSVTSQSYENRYLVIVNDGSTDATGELAARYSAGDDRISVLHQENGGQIAARDAGIAYALTHSDQDAYLMFLDADDELKPGALQRIAELIDMHGCDMLVFGAENYDADTDKIRGMLSGNAQGKVQSKSELYKIVLYDTGYNSLCRKVIAKKAFLTTDYVAYTDLRYGEDLIQSLDYYRSVGSVYFTQDVLYRYHINPDSMTHSVDFYSYPIDSTVRRLTWEFVNAENVWSEEELNEYAQFLLDLLEKKIISLCCFKAPFEDKAKVFDSVIDEPFYSMLLQRDLTHGRIIELLLKRRYKTMIAAAKARKIAARVTG